VDDEGPGGPVKSFVRGGGGGAAAEVYRPQVVLPFKKKLSFFLATPRRLTAK